MKPFDFKIGKDEYTFEVNDYFWVEEIKNTDINPVIRYRDSNIPGTLPITSMPKLAQKEWKRIKKLGLLRFEPHPKLKHVKKYYLK